MIAWALETLIASTLLMLIVLAIRGPVARYFGPHIAYGLWLLPALRLLLPPLPEEVAPAPLHMLPGIDIEALLTAPLPMAAGIEPGVEWPLLILCLWGVGAASFLAWHLYSYRRFVQTAIGQATQLPRLDRDGVEVCASPVAGGPFAAGIFLKAIVLPEDYRKRYEKDELRLAIEHEIEHHRRGDMSANFVALVVLALHWWNPIAHWAHRAFRVDQELACDAVVLADATPAERHAYGSALLKSACDRLPVAACALGAGGDLKRRLRMMKVYRWNPARARVGSVIAAAMVGGGLLLTASNGIAAETTKEVERKVRTTLSQPIAAPLPPQPLTPPASLAVPVPPRTPRAPLAPLAPLPPTPPEAVDNEDDRDVGVDVDTDGLETGWINGAEIARHASAAASAAAHAAHEAVDQAHIAREVAVELRREMPTMRIEIGRATAEARSPARAAARTCSARSQNVSFRIDGKDGKHMSNCHDWAGIDEAQMRKTIIVSLRHARASIAAMETDVLARSARDRALAEVDRKLAELRAAK